MVVILSLVGRILESDEPLRFSRIAHNPNCRIQESDLPLKPKIFNLFRRPQTLKKPSEPMPLKGISTTRKENP